MNFNDAWRRKSNLIGRVMIPIIMLASFGPLIYVKLAYGLFPDWSIALTAWATIAAMFGAFYILEPFSYFPILGLAGTYMTFTTGHISDLRVPASAMAQAAVGVEPGSKKAEVVSTIGIAGSVFVTLVAIFLATMVGSTVIDLLPDSVVDAFSNYAITAIIAPVYVQFCAMQPKLSFLIVIAGILYLIGGEALATIMMFVSLIVAIIIARILYKKGFFDKGKTDNSSTV